MSSKKPFEYIEDKIKLAAENSVPAFDEKAWEAMEAKLDGDRKKRGAWIWWLLPVLILGGWATCKMLVPATHDTKELAATQHTTPGTEAAARPATGNTAPAVVTASAEENTAGQKLGNRHTEGGTITATGGSAYPTGTNSTGRLNEQAGELHHIKKITGKKKGTAAMQFTGAATGEDRVTENEPAETPEPVASAPAQKGDLQTISTHTTSPEKTGSITGGPMMKKESAATARKDTIPQKPAAQQQKNEKKKGVARGFYVLATGGADISNTKFLSFKNSDVKPKYGLGMGYQLAKRWSIQSGFYVSDKKYVAAPADYHIKPGSPMGTYPLEKINASCLVYEIPLQVKYDFLKKNSFALYATAGMSSYIMQKEQYDCFYNYYGNLYENNWEYKGNKHWFSVAVFSIGMEKYISPKFSILAEPSFSIPVSGVGDGKMKLYSATVQAGIKYYFFNRK